MSGTDIAYGRLASDAVRCYRRAGTVPPFVRPIFLRISFHMVLCISYSTTRSSYASATLSSYASRTRCPIVLRMSCPIVLRICYAMSGTDIVHIRVPAHVLCDVRSVPNGRRLPGTNGAGPDCVAPAQGRTQIRESDSCFGPAQLIA
eukprot:1478257-Rhodomonas_salina.1